MGAFTSEDEGAEREGTATVVIETDVVAEGEPAIVEPSSGPRPHAAEPSSGPLAHPPEAIPHPAEPIPHPAEPIPHPAREEIELAAVLHALSDPVRLQIVGALADAGEVNCKSIVLPVSKSTCTHHFRVLREAGVIRQRIEGTTRLNSLRRTDLEAQFPGLIEAVLGAAGGSGKPS